MLIKLIKSVTFKQAHIANHLMHLTAKVSVSVKTETFAVKLLQIVVSDVSPKKVLAHIILIELKKIKKIHIYDVTNSQVGFCQSKADVRYTNSVCYS